MAGLWSVLKYGRCTGRRHVPLVCGRAPGRALSSGHLGNDSMDFAWVGPLYWVQWAGGRRRLHPRGRRNGPGGMFCLPDHAPVRLCAEPARSVWAQGFAVPIRPKIDPGCLGQSAHLPPDLGALREFLGRKMGRIHVVRAADV